MSEKKTHLEEAIEIFNNVFNISSEFHQNAVSKGLIKNESCSTQENQEQIDQTFLTEKLSEKEIVKQPWQRKESEFYYHINKSLLNAEYLFIKDYSKQLNNALISFEATEATSVIKYPRFVRDFFILAPKMIELCERIKNAIGESNNRRIEIEDRSEENANRITSRLKIEIDEPTPNSDKLFRFTLSVIEMTSIDHIYKVSSDNIDKLLTLWERIKDIDDINDNNLKTVVTIVTGKTATMIWKMVFENGDENSSKYLNIDNLKFFFRNSEDIKDKIKDHKLEDKLNKTIKYKSDHRNQNLTKEELERNNPKLTSSTGNVPDIEDYNKWVERGQEHYIEMSSTVGAIEQKNNPDQVISHIESFILKIEEKKDHDIECFSPFFFISSIYFVNEQLSEQLKQKQSDNFIKLLNLMNKLLMYMERYIRTFTNSMPTIFRPYFEHCFYQYDITTKKFSSFNLDNFDYHRDKFDNAFFFASYYCNATNFGRLHDFYEKYLLQFQTFSYESSQIILTKEAQNIKKELGISRKEFNDFKIEIDKTSNDFKKEIDKTRQSSLQTLGLFAAFLAIIISSIGTFRVVNNIWEYIIYSLTYTLAIALFAFLISERTQKKNTENEKENTENEKENTEKKKENTENEKENTEKKKENTEKKKENTEKKKCDIVYIVRNYSKECAFIITFVFLLSFSIIYFIFINNHHIVSEDKNETKSGVTFSIHNSNTPSSTVHNSNTPSSTVSLESALSNDNDTLNDNISTSTNTP